MFSLAGNDAPPSRRRRRVVRRSPSSPRPEERSPLKRGSDLDSVSESRGVSDVGRTEGVGGGGRGRGRGVGRGRGGGGGGNGGGGGHQGGRNSALQLNDGAKWKVAQNVLNTMEDVKTILNSFNGNTIEDYEQFGKDIFNSAKQILLNKENKGEIWDQLHVFFNKMEEDMHSLMSVETIEEGEKLKNQISNKVEKFGDFFE